MGLPRDKAQELGEDHAPVVMEVEECQGLGENTVEGLGGGTVEGLGGGTAEGWQSGTSRIDVEVNIEQEQTRKGESYCYRTQRGRQHLSIGRAKVWWVHVLRAVLLSTRVPTHPLLSTRVPVHVLRAWGLEGD